MLISQKGENKNETKGDTKINYRKVKRKSTEAKKNYDSPLTLRCNGSLSKYICVHQLIGFCAKLRCVHISMRSFLTLDLSILSVVGKLKSPTFQ